ncbi:MAG: PEP/pyruvate-binding domain-containing protein [Oscillospiraceae bacterium]|nr:PEP/pyruvate-binding domain-containing protein [Oscillospiraceae bacterium]
MYGGKADNLILMRDNGIPVPEFVVVTDGKAPDVAWEISSVRSSADVEDGASDSFAGQFDTFLGVAENELQERIDLCMASVSNKGAAEYLKQREIGKDIKMSVIVQKMIDADLAGIMFTSNPQGIMNECVITVGKGTGDKVVSDRTDTTSYYYNTNDDLYYYEGADDMLTSDQIHDLIGISSKIKELLGDYLDIEFSIKDGRIYILQARKITTFAGCDPSKFLILDNSNIVESYPNLSLPLTCGFVGFVYSGVFEGLCRRIIGEGKYLDGLKPVFGNMVGNVNGRMYYKISNWYTLIKFLPFRKKIIPVWQEMLGVKNKTYDEKQDMKVSFAERMRINRRIIRAFLNSPSEMEKLNREFIRINDEFYMSYHEGMSNEELLAQYAVIEKKLLACWDITLINDLYTFVYTGLLKHFLRKKYDDADDKTNEFLSGITNIESLKPVRAMIDLAYHRKELSQEEFEKRTEEYIKLYGDRNLEELKLESPTFRTDPSLLIRKIDEYCEDEAKLEEIYKSIMKDDARDMSGESRRIRKLAARCTTGISNREISRLNRSRIYGMVREIVRSLGKNFLAAGLIDSEKDIFYLTYDEMFAMAKEPFDAKDRIKQRKNEYRMYKCLPAFSRIIFEKKEFSKHHVSVNSHRMRSSEDVMQGVPCSGGISEGEALVVEDISMLEGCKDKILVTKMTDPGWVFYLASAKGVISQKGSILSHTAIISREIGIPSVVGVTDVMNRINTGDIVKMDGSSGRIEIVRRKE